MTHSLPDRSDCTCDVKPPRHAGIVGRGLRYAIYLDQIEDDTVFDPACPFHGKGGTMVAVVPIEGKRKSNMELVPANTDIVVDNVEVLEGELIDDDNGFLVETWRNPDSYDIYIKVVVKDTWQQSVPREWIDEVGAIRDRLFEIARRPTPSGI